MADPLAGTALRVAGQRLDHPQSRTGRDTGALHLYRLAGGTYREHSVTRPGEVLRLTEPVEVSIAPDALLPPG